MNIWSVITRFSLERGSKTIKIHFGNNQQQPVEYWLLNWKTWQVKAEIFSYILQWYIAFRVKPLMRNILS